MRGEAPLCSLIPCIAPDNFGFGLSDKPRDWTYRVAIRASWGKHAPLTPLVHRQYVDAAPHARDRLGMWTFAREVLDASDWYAGLWKRRDRIKDVPALLLWGLNDPAFGARFLRPFEELFANARVVRYPDVGHFVPDEAGDEAAEEIERFLASPELVDLPATSKEA